MAAIFSTAVPFPPEMIAPAWPIRFPGGAVTLAAAEDATNKSKLQSPGAVKKEAENLTARWQA